MNIILNNSPETIKSDNISIGELIKEKNFTFKMLVVKVNDKLIKKEDYDSTHIKNGDNVIILHLISGG